MIEASIFFEIGLVIIIATILAYFSRMFKQPLILGYIATGFLLGPMILGLVKNPEIIRILSELGIAFLLFTVGIELKISDLKEVGRISFILGVGQIVFTSILGYLILMFFSFTSTEGWYIAIALTLSSTVIIVKFLSEKNDLNSLYGKIVIGLLLVQDLFVILVLIFLSGFKTEISIMNFAWIAGKGVILFVLALVSGKYVLPHLYNSIARSQELLFLTSLSVCFLFAIFSELIGFSIEIGALIAGVTLASTPYNFEISAKIRPLRDFFITMFFVLLGMQLVFEPGSLNIVAIIVLSLFVLIGNPLIVMMIMGMMGYMKRVSFLSGITIAQISEFSLVLAALGMRLGHISQGTVSMITVIGLVTILVSSYMIKYGNNLYSFMKHYLVIFQKKKTKKIDFDHYYSDFSVLLCGYNRIGYSILKTLGKLQKKLLVVDFNPDTIRMLKHRGIHCLYGDVSDIELIESLKLDHVEMIVSTVPDTNDNIMLVEKAKHVNKDIITIVTASQIEEALKLYDHGADYVVLPHFLGGDHVSLLIEDFSNDFTNIVKTKLKHIHDLHVRKSLGHEHPSHI